MNSAEAIDDDDLAHATGSILTAAPDVVEVRRNGGLAALIGAAASGVAIAYLGRASSTGAALDWVLFAVMGLLGALHLHAFVDARTPLLVADSQGVRIRLGRAWRGMPWGALAAVEHSPRPGFLRDGRLVLVPRNPERVLAELDTSGRRQSKVSEKLYGAPFALPLGLSTRVTGIDEDLTTALRQLAGNSARVVELVPETGEAVEPEVEIVESEETGRSFALRWPDPRPALAAAISVLARRFQRGVVEGDEAEAEVVPEPEPIVASETPKPLRMPRLGTRVEARTAATVDPAEGRELRRHGSVNLVEETQAWGDRVRPISRGGDAVAPLVIDAFEVDPAEDPVIGPELSAARTRLGLTVDQLADRTRIRPHVIESIEVDDFAPCGGDFYARGHLRTLARVLGKDATPLLAAYDERYADAPINARRVFEAELATGMNGGIRSTRGGPNWSVLVAAIMTVVLAWSIARLAMDTPVELQSPAPTLRSTADGSGIPNFGATIRLKITGSGEGSHVEVRDRDGEMVFSGFLAAGESRTYKVSGQAKVKAADAGAVEVKVNGEDKGPVGKKGTEATKVLRTPR